MLRRRELHLITDPAAEHMHNGSGRAGRNTVGPFANFAQRPDQGVLLKARRGPFLEKRRDPAPTASFRLFARGFLGRVAIL